jgi:DNA-binding response OmpR family regulator
MRILVVEDDKKVANFILNGLKEEFYAVDVAYDGDEGQRLAIEFPTTSSSSISCFPMSRDRKF